MAKADWRQFRRFPKGETMQKLLFAFATLALLATAIPANAGNCTTTCNRSYGGGQTCNTWCY
jgi:hypothetical protein